MPLLFRNSVIVQPTQVDNQKPTITSASAYSFAEGDPVIINVTADRSLEGLQFSGGDDDGEFTLDPLFPTITDPEGVVRDYETPTDADEDNVYNIEIIATGVNGVDSDPFAIAITITDVSEVTTPDPADLTATVMSDTEVRLQATSTNALTIEWKKSTDSIWQSEAAPLDVTVGGHTPSSTVTFQARGVNGPAIGTQDTANATFEAAHTVAEANPITFGAPGYLTRVNLLTGLADGKTGTHSLWIRFDDDLGVRPFSNGGNRWTLRRQTNGTLQFVGLDVTATKAVELISTETVASGSGWHHILIAYDLANSLAKMYLDGTEVTYGTQTIADLAIDYTNGNVSIGAFPDGTVPVVGAMAEVFFHDVYTDFTDLRNIRKFRTSLGLPRELGSDGSTPLSVRPIVFLSGTTASWHTNKGTGGGFTINGALSQASNGPAGVPIPPVQAGKADDFVEMQSLQSHCNFQTVPWWADHEGWTPILNASHVRYSRTGLGPNNSSHRAPINYAYENFGTRFSISLNTINSDGSFNLSNAQTVLNNIKATTGTEPLGVHKVIAIEGANEYQRNNLFERRFTVNTSTNVVTTTNTGYQECSDPWPPASTGTGNFTYSSANHGYTTSNRVQVRPANGATLPSPLQEKTPYWVLEPSGATLKLATQAAPGSAIDITTAGSGNFFISPWAARFVDFQAWLWNAVTTDATLSAAVTAGDLIVRSGSIWERLVYHYDQIAAEGGIGSTAHRSNLHLYNAARKPSVYNGETGNDPNIEAFQEAQLMGNLTVDETEYGFNVAHSFGGTPISSSCTVNIGSKYAGRALCENWLLHTNITTYPAAGILGTCSYYSLQDNIVGTPHRWGLIGQDHTERAHYYTVRNLNSYAVEATWDDIGLEWTYPVYDPGTAQITVTPDPAYANPEFIKWFILEKEDGTLLLYIWNDAVSWNRSTGQEIAVSDVNCTIRITSPTYQAIAVYEPTVLDAEVANTKRDTPVSQPSVSTLATSGITVAVPDHVAVVKFTP